MHITCIKIIGRMFYTTGILRRLFFEIQVTVKRRQTSKDQTMDAL